MASSKVKRYSFIVVVLAALSVTMQIAANLVSGRLGFFGPWLAPMGVFFFPFVYIISDVTSDVYGYRVSRWIAWLTILVQLLFVGMILLVINAVKPAPFVLNMDEALRLLIIGTDGTSGMLRVMLAGVAAAVLGGWVNDIIFQLFRHVDGEGKFLKRKLISSAGAELVDTTVFITLGFFGTPSWSIAMYIVQFCLKYAVEIITSPVAKVCSSKLRVMEGTGVFEDRNKFNIFGFEKKQAVK